MRDTPHAEELRRQAEERLAARSRRIETLKRADLVHLAHELAVHQIELEIQNDELRRTQVDAQEARDRYLDLYDFAPVGYFTLDEHSRIVEVNLTGCRLLRAERQALLDTRFTKFLAPEETEKFYFHRQKVLASGVQQACELKIRMADGGAFDARLESIRAGRERLRVALTDVTERKRADEQLRELTRTLENRVAERTQELEHRARQLQKITLELSLAEDRERKRLAQILHDDLQQLIAAAKFHVSLLRNRMKYDASSQAVASQIDDLLKEAIEKSRDLSHELSPAVLHDDDFVGTLGWLAKQMQAKHGLVVYVHADSQGHLQSDAIRSVLYRAVQELLFNVAKHARVSEASIRFRRRGQYVCLLVSDRGRGFDPQDLREAVGYGLLSASERVESLGGRMEIKSAAGQGSRFFVVVPDSEAEGAEVETGLNHPMAVAERAAHEDRGRIRVLLADDHKIVRDGLRSRLGEEYDIEIVGEAAHGGEAVDLALGLEPDVVIMDVAMPSIDGDVATRRIKEQLPRTRVIALSTYKEPEVIERMYRAGAETYVLKTASPEDLLAAIRGQRDRLQVEVESSQGPVGSNDWPPRAPRNAVGWPDPGPPASPGTPHAATP